MSNGREHFNDCSPSQTQKRAGRYQCWNEERGRRAYGRNLSGRAQPKPAVPLSVIHRIFDQNYRRDRRSRRFSRVRETFVSPERVSTCSRGKQTVCSHETVDRPEERRVRRKNGRIPVRAPASFTVFMWNITRPRLDDVFDISFRDLRARTRTSRISHGSTRTYCCRLAAVRTQTRTRPHSIDGPDFRTRFALYIHA